MEKLNAEIIRQSLGKSIFSGNIILYESAESTNRTAREIAKKGGQEGTIVLAEEQTSGRGRMDRKWISPPYENLLFTIILRPEINIENLFILTMTFSVAVIEAINEEANILPMIKWPNDIYMEDGKLGGILTEFSVKGDIPEYVVIGLGLNVNWSPEKNSEILYPSTNIRKESGKEISRNRLLVNILKRFESCYNKVISGQWKDLHNKWNNLSMVTGKEVTISGYNKIKEGTAMGIDEKGALILRCRDGNEVRILSGDVSLRF